MVVSLKVFYAGALEHRRIVFNAVIIKEEESNVAQIRDSSAAYQDQLPDRMAPDGKFDIRHSLSRPKSFDGS